MRVISRATRLAFPFFFIDSEDEKPLPMKEIVFGTYRGIVLCPESLESPNFAPLLHNPDFITLISHIIVDEVHSVIEAGTYRSSYTRLNNLRRIAESKGAQIPIVAMTATMPPHYRSAVNASLGLKLDTYNINLGNFRPELSMVIMEIDGGPGRRFQELDTLLFGSGNLATNNGAGGLPKTIVYVDDIKLLTELFWWITGKLVRLGLAAVRMVDVYHAGMSEVHKKLVQDDFAPITSHLVLLLASEALGCGANPKGVQRVIQYRCSGLTMSQVSQRFGRGGREDGGSSVGYLLHEKRLGLEGTLSPEQPGTEDFGLLQLIQLENCCNEIVDRYFNNPPRLLEAACRCCRCCPAEPNTSEARFEWIMEDPAEFFHGATKPAAELSTDQREELFALLDVWREKTWRLEWRDEWIWFGPGDLISDSDLKNIVKNAAKINSLDDLRAHTGIVYWTEISGPLYRALQEYGNQVSPTLPLFPSNNNTAPLPTQTPSAAPPPDTIYSQDVAWKALAASHKRKLHEGESVFLFCE